MPWKLQHIFSFLLFHHPTVYGTCCSTHCSAHKQHMCHSLRGLLQSHYFLASECIAFDVIAISIDYGFGATKCALVSPSKWNYNNMVKYRHWRAQTREHWTGESIDNGCNLIFAVIKWMWRVDLDIYNIFTAYQRLFRRLAIPLWEIKYFVPLWRCKIEEAWI